MLKRIKFVKYLILIIIIEIISCFKYPINKKLIDAELGEISSIEVGTKAEFDQYVMSNEYVISIFHADWCGHCKRFLPVFDEASKYKIVNNKWKFLKIPCSKYGSLCDSFNINGYPTIKTFKQSKEIKRSPPRELDTFLEYLLKISNSPLIDIENNNITKFYKDYGTFSPIIKYNSKNNNFFSCIKNLADNDFLIEYYFGLSKNDKDEEEKIIFDFDNNSIIFNWNEKCEDAKTFLKNNLFPLISDIDISFMRQMNKYGKRVFMLFYNSNNEKLIKFIIDNFKKISKDNRNIVFGYVIQNKNRELSSYFKVNLTKESEMHILIYDFGKEITYHHPINYDINIINEKELENNIRNIIKNINNLPFTSGSKFKDFFRKIGFYDLSSTSIMILIICFFLVLIGILCYLVFCCDSEDFEEEMDIKDKKLLEKIKKMNKKENKEEKSNLKENENGKKIKKD